MTPSTAAQLRRVLVSEIAVATDCKTRGPQPDAKLAGELHGLKHALRVFDHLEALEAVTAQEGTA